MQNTSGKWNILNYALTAAAWLVSVVLGLYAIYGVTEIVALAFVKTGGENPYELQVLRYVFIFIAAIAWLFAIIYSGEYALKHPGNRGTWKRFGWILGIEGLVSIITLFLS